MRALPEDVAVEACTWLAEVLSGSDDYVRKVPCVRWYHNLAAKYFT